MATSSSNTLKWIFGIAAFLIVALLIYIFRCKIFNMKSCVQQEADKLNKSHTPVPSGSPTHIWIPEHFDLDLGMIGPKIKALQTKLSIPADRKFGPQTKAAVINAGYSVPLSQDDYNSILNISTPINPIGKIAYANKNGVDVLNADYSVYKTAAKGEWIGTVIKNDPSTSVNFYTVVGNRLVATANVDLKKNYEYRN